MIDVRGKPVEITISEDRKTVWVNTLEGCQFRAQSIPELKIVDSHKKKSGFIYLATRAATRAYWVFVLCWIGVMIFSWLFDILGLGNHAVGVTIGAVVGITSGYFLGKRTEMKRLKQ